MDTLETLNLTGEIDYIGKHNRNYGKVKTAVDAVEVQVSALQGASGTVTSVGVSAPSEFSVTGSPITGAGVIAIEKASQAQNTVYAAPVSGGTGVPSFRRLTVDDMPDGIGGGLQSIANGTLLANISGSPAVPTAVALSALLDNLLGAVRGSILYRGSSGWATLVPSTAGRVLYDGGSGNDPYWGDLSGDTPLTTKGELLGFSTTPVAVAVGTNGQFLVADSTAAAGVRYASRSELFGTGLTASEVGTRNIPINSQSTNYTLVAADSGGCIYHPTSDTTARTWTIPSNASVAYPVGTAITFDNDIGAGVITISINSDTLVWVGEAGGIGSRTLASGGQATAVKVQSTRWRISGSGLT